MVYPAASSPVRRLLPPLLLLALLTASLTPRLASPAAASPAAAVAVRSVSPAPGTPEVATASTIVVAFDRPVTALGGVGERPAPSPLISTPPLPGSGRWLTTSIYRWTPGALRGATQYHLTIPAGLTAVDGTTLASSYSWQFSTIRPRLLTVSPPDGYQYALPRPTVSLTFNQSMDHASTQAAFRLADPQGRTVPGTFAWPSPALLRFLPSHALLRSAQYRAVLAPGARSAEGPLPLLAPAAWSVVVAPYLHVTGSVPGEQARDVDPNAGVTISFSAPVDERSAVASVRLAPEVSNRYVGFGGDDLSLQISGQFAPSTAYTVTVQPSLRARAGDLLGAPFHLHFVTAPLPPQFSFVTGSVAAYDWYRPIVLSLQAINPGPITYRINRLDRGTFINALSDVYNLGNSLTARQSPWLQLTQVPNAPLNKTVPVRMRLTLANGRPLPVGYYLVAATGAGQAADYQLLLVTRTNLTIKVSRDQALLWATDLATGAPVAGLPLQVMAANANVRPPRMGVPLGGSDSSTLPVVGVGRTSSQGTAMIAVPANPRQPYTLADYALLATGVRASDAVLASINWGNGISPADFGLAYASSQPRIRMNLATDRPIYRPGQVVHLRGVARADDDGRYSLVAGAVQLVLTDATGKVATKRTMLLDQFGAFHADFPLLAGASLGSYNLSATSGDQSTYASLQVAEYRKPTYSVSITTPASTYSLGQTIPARVAVSYYFGGGVAHARVHWSVLGYNYLFASDVFGEYAFGAYDPAGSAIAAGSLAYAPICRDCGSRLTLYQGDAVTDAQGIVRLRLPAKLAKGQLAQTYSLEADVTDIDNQPVAGRTSVTVYSSALQIGLQADQQIADPGKPDVVHALTLADDGITPVGGVPLHIAIYHRVYHTVITTNPDGSPNQQYLPKDTLLQTLDRTTDLRGRTTFPFIAPQGGEYHIVARARDHFGNSAQTSLEIYAGGEKPIDWGLQPQARIRLIADKRAYHSGDIAHVLVTTPYSNMLGLVTIERGRILQYTVRRFAGTATRLDIPVLASYLPDTYVSVVAERGSAAGLPPVWRLGYARLHVDTAERRVHLNITPGRPRVGPGQTLSLSIHAVDARGNPVRAQVGLSLVDAANLALAGDSGTGSDLLGIFYGPRELGVLTADTLNISPEQLITRPVAPRHAAALGSVPSLPAATPGGSAGGKVQLSRNLDGASGQQVAVRQNFQDTAYWNAAVVTDSQGNARLAVPLPDNVTTWKILGKAVTAGSLFGSATGSVMATKDLLLRPILPRFFTLGDRARIGASVNNTTAQAITARLRLRLADGDPGAAPAVIGEQTVRLAPGGETNVSWPVTLASLGTATMLVEAVDLAHPATNDAVRMAVPVRENSTPEDVATSGQAGASTVEQVRIPAGIEANEGSLTVTLEPTLASGLRVGADFLARYPYQSSIDLASQILGESELGRLPTRASVLTTAERHRLPVDLAQRLALLYLDQRGDGGFGWWIDDTTSSPYITVSVVDALITARDLGYGMNATVLANAVAYLLARAQAPSALDAAANYDADLQAGLALAVTRYGRGAEVAALIDQLVSARYLLSHAAEADLVTALATRHAAADRARMSALLADLTGSARTSATAVHWDEPSYNWAALDSDIATTAAVLDALTVAQPDSPLVPGAVRWLMAARKANAWESTDATAASLRALVDYILGSGELRANYHYTVTLNGALWGAGVVDSANLSQNRVLTQPIGVQAPAGSSQRIGLARDVRPGNGSLNYLIRLRYFRPVDRVMPVSQGVSVSRSYLTPDGASAALGSTIRVRLRVTVPQDLFYLTLEDPLPAGAEAVDSSLQTTSQLAQVNNSTRIPSGTSDLTWYVTHSDLRDDRTVLFLDFLPAGTYQYTYLIHAATQGTYHALPTHIQQSYFPEVFGRGAGSYFRVR